MNRVASLMCSAAFVLLAGCAEGDPGPYGEDGDAVLLGPNDVRLFTRSESIAQVHDIEVLPDGQVWVQNSTEPIFLGFDPDGALIRAHGVFGGGPTEFGAPGGLVVGGIDGQAWTFDAARNVLRQVSGEEGSWARTSLPDATIPPGSVYGTNPFVGLVRAHRLGSDVLLPRRSGDLDTNVAGIWVSLWTADLVAVQVGAGTAREVISLRNVLGDPAGTFDLDGAPLPFPFWFRLWTVCGDEEVRVYDRFRNELRGFAPDGSEIDPIPLPPARLDAISPRDFARVMFDLAAVEQMGAVPSGSIQVSPADSAQVLTSFVARIEASPEQLANLLPRHVDLRCDATGVPWIQPFDIEEPGPAMAGLRGGRSWFRLAPGGPPQEIRFPDRFDPYRFEEDRIWGVQRDDLDVASIAWVENPFGP